MADLLRSQARINGLTSPRELVNTSSKWRKWLAENLSPSQSTELIESWLFNARDKQCPPSKPYRIWMGCTGRGTGKNLVLSHHLHREAALNPGRAGFMAAMTRSEVISVIVGHPECGVMVTQDPANPCTFKQYRGVYRVEWANGAYAEIQTSEEPEGGRGHHYAFGVCDEIGTWTKRVDRFGATLFENLELALRAGPHPRMFIATSPRPVELVRRLLKEGETPDSEVIVYRESLLDNAANLPASYIASVLRRFKGTRLYDQEVSGLLLDDLENAILTHDMLNTDRVAEVDLPEMVRVVIGCDPALKKKKKSDKTGISVAGRCELGHLYALENRSFRGTPTEWGSELVRLSYKYENASIVAEDNVIGDAIQNVVQGCVAEGDPMPRVMQRTASKSKAKRAEPILGYHERHEAHLVGDSDSMRALQDQLCLFTPLEWGGDGSPDDADSYVYAGTELMLSAQSNWDDMVAANG
jgi:phage terminase large subunit-like protein